MKKFILSILVICSSCSMTTASAEGMSKNGTSTDVELADLNLRLDALERKMDGMTICALDPQTVTFINAAGRVCAAGLVICVAIGIVVMLKSRWDQSVQKQKNSDVDDLDDESK